MSRCLSATGALLESVLRFLCGTLGIGIVLLMFAQVLFRYFGNEPLSWSEEVIRDAFIWCSFFGAALAQRYRLHVALELVDSYPARVRDALHIAVPLALCAFLAVIGYSGVKLTIASWQVNSVALEIPMSLPYAAVPCGAFIMIVFAIDALVNRKVTSP